MVCPHLAVPQFAAILLGNECKTPGTARARIKDHRCGRRVGRTLNQSTVFGGEISDTAEGTNNVGLDPIEKN